MNKIHTADSQLPGSRKDVIENLVVSNVNHFGCNDISLFWKEKLLLVIDSFQLYGVIWIISKAWNLPLPYLKFSLATCIFNLDFVSLLDFFYVNKHDSKETLERSQFGEFHSNYLLFCLIFNILLVLPMVYFYMFYVRKSFLIWKKDQKQMEMKLIIFYYLLYLPTCLINSRIFLCSANNFLLVDPKQSCILTIFDNQQYMTTMVSSFIVLAFYVISFPIYLYQQIHKLNIYKHQGKQHHEYIIRKEVECNLGITNDWQVFHYQLISSFKLAGMYHYPVMLMKKLFVVVVFMIFHDSPEINSVLLFCFYVLHLGWMCYYSPFRVKSSNHMYKLLAFMVTYNLYFLMMKANRAFNAYTVNSNITANLILSNSLMLFIVVGILFRCAVVQYKQPVNNSLVDTSYFYWPVSTKEIQIILDADAVRNKLSLLDGSCDDKLVDPRQWIILLRESYVFISKTYITNDYLTPMDDILKQIDLLKQCWIPARSVRHLLHITIEECINTLLVLHRAKAPFSVLSSQHKCLPEFKSLLPSFCTKVNFNYNATIMMNPKKRRVMFKLYALKCLIGNRKLAKVPLTQRKVLLAPPTDLQLESQAADSASQLAIDADLQLAPQAANSAFSQLAIDADLANQEASFYKSHQQDPKSVIEPEIEPETKTEIANQ